MPLSAKFRREMLTAMKTAKKKKEQNGSDETEEIDTDIVRNESILSKPVDSAQPLAIEETSNEKNIESTKK
ncbi:unnamed protein product [Pieris macdunnoughi]|uniref:Uncharacterized protein n=1 Tax=Pieris macdunnoughi TaxID=345717 RepID=A0A821XL54_9NEOP|nr:unnamed protein product [Pieris macdunnoughi]